MYPSYDRNWDDQIFREAILKKVGTNSICLDYGAGRGVVKQMNFFREVKFIAGVDLDEAVFNNPNLHEAKKLDLSNPMIPYGDDYFDLVFSDNVMEHIDNPSYVFGEVNRVLKPGGIFISKTPNFWHYMPQIARLLPVRIHRLYNSLRGRKEIDTFATLYRCNTSKKVIDLAKSSGFEVISIRLIEGRPEYLRLTFLSYILGILYERFVNLSDSLSIFRSVLIFELRKK